MSPSPAPTENACLGIIKLDTRFPRPSGDTGNPDTFSFPVRYSIVRGASPRRVVCERASGLLQPFIAAGQELVAQGAAAITTTCGFLALFQQELARALPVPVATSSLMQAAWVAPMLPAGKRVGIITINAEALSEDHLACAGVPTGSPIEGIGATAEFRRRILNDESVMDYAAARDDVVRCAVALKEKHRDVGAIVMECTNMPPYRADVGKATGLPVFDALTLARWLWDGVCSAPRSPAQGVD
jgi:Asp/Glu/hydantoin racemase